MMKWNIGAKIGALCVFILTALAGLGIISYLSISAVVEDVKVYTRTIDFLNSNDAVMIGLEEAESAQRGYLLTGAREFQGEYESSKRKAEERLRDFIKSAGNRKEQEMVAKFEPVVHKRLEQLNEVIEAYNRKGLTEARALMLSHGGGKVMSEMKRVHDDIDRMEHEMISQKEDALKSSTRRAIFIILLGVPIAMGVTGLAGLQLVRNISAPLRELTRTAERIASGNLSNEAVVEVARFDEIGVLSNAFARMNRYLRTMASVAQKLAHNDLSVQCEPVSEHDQLGNAFRIMVENFRQMVRQIQESTILVANSTAQLAAMTAQLATSAAETATAVNETTTTIEEVKITAQLVNQKSGSVTESARNTSQITLSGRKSVEETMKGMDRIRQQMDFIAQSVVRLSEQSMAIGEIISSVSDLASQSNLLAVNASIEAAKAGEQGKGFAVVAQEVRSLAEQSKDATEQVRGILNDIQKAISSAVMATEQGGKIVEIGVRQSGETEETIRTIEEGAVDTVQAAAQILASTNEQVVGLNQVSLAMENIRTASDQIVLSTRQAEESMAQLNDMGRRLRQMVEQFKVA